MLIGVFRKKRVFGELTLGVDIVKAKVDVHFVEGIRKEEVFDFGLLLV